MFCGTKSAQNSRAVLWGGTSRGSGTTAISTGSTGLTKTAFSSFPLQPCYLAIHTQNQKTYKLRFSPSIMTCSARSPCTCKSIKDNLCTRWDLFKCCYQTHETWSIDFALSLSHIRSGRTCNKRHQNVVTHWRLDLCHVIQPTLPKNAPLIDNDRFIGFFLTFPPSSSASFFAPSSNFNIAIKYLWHLSHGEA
jgi:hypothetical protein